MSLQWFRLYADIVDDDKLRLLAYEDRWHFVALCALKCDGLLDRLDDPLRERKIAIKTGLQLKELEEVKRRLMEVGLIDDNFLPLKWEKRQYRKPNLPEGESLDGYAGYVYFIADDFAETVKIGFSKNPWARVKDLQTGRHSKLSVVATVKTTDASEVKVHDLFADERAGGEWFSYSSRIQGLVKRIKAKRIKDIEGVVSYVSNYVAATKDTEADTDTDREPKGSSETGVSPVRPSEIVEAWNITAADLDLPAIVKLTEDRKRKLSARCKDTSLEEFQAALATIRRSRFLQGHNDKGWKANFDFFLQPKSFTKLIEGSYD